ncbi:laminin subunit alpha-1 [Neosynchiropus ocellatus]
MPLFWKMRNAALMVLMMVELTTAQQRGLFPAIFNLASTADIISNATCGDPEPEVYCKLVEHVPGRLIKNPHCPKCDANSILTKERHPITNAIDGTNEWWQSPSIKNGQQFHWVTITLDLKQIFQVAYIIIKSANSPRPGNWILERSVDGVNFDPWQFYALSDSECLSRYNMTPRLGPPTYKSDTEVICTSYYSRLNPLEHGEIHTSLINGRPGADDLTSDLLDFGSARYIRLRLQRIRTLNADLMTLSINDPRDVDPIVTRRYYYSIKDISVGGMCICYGHAESCPLDPLTKKLQCVCEHNTCGESCNQCCPGFHQLPWQPGTISEGNTCEKCNCHNKTTECVYNQTVADLRLSVNIHGVYLGGGVCVDCQQKTAGINCETCIDGYYRSAEVSPYWDSPCVECDCDLSGSASSVCSKDDSQPGGAAGQCVCKRGFAGRRCDRCEFGFRDFPDCIECECDLAGSINTDPCSDCTCKENVMGAHCDLCKPGFYNLQPSNPLGCTHCFCFGVSDVCESSSWSVTQVVTTNASLYHAHSSEQHLNLLHDKPTHPVNRFLGFEHQAVQKWTAPKGFLGNKLTSYGGFLKWSVVSDTQLDRVDEALLGHTDVIIEGNSQSILLSPAAAVSLSPLALQSFSVKLVPQNFIDPHAGVAKSRDDLLMLLADVASVEIRLHLNPSTVGRIRLISVSLDTADAGLGSGVPAAAVENCECPWGYSGTSCETCRPGFYRVAGVLFGGNCLQCECNDHASQCDVYGVCLDCSHNTSGPHCDQCLPGYYGDATDGSAEDCQRCPCPLTMSSNSFSPTCVLGESGHILCDRCQEGYTGNNCERCSSGYYGSPLMVGGSCVRCECNGNVNVDEEGHCDAVTGECLLCHGHTAGIHCEVCEAGYYGDAVHAKNCTACDCSEVGALSKQCDVSSGLCLCRENVTGRTCDRCKAGFFGLRSGGVCVACGCHRLGSLSEFCGHDGRCECKQGIDGDKCDQCGHGYHGFHAGNCTACNCKHTRGNCHPDTGECICPAHTVGDTCDRCEKNHWDHDPVRGCKPCGCSEEGSLDPQCHLTDGQCRCKEGFSGRHCHHCATGYYGYPACTACDCDMAGTLSSFCNSTLGKCDCLGNGECVCKEGVSGRHCEECVAGSFGLSDENPSGCSQCFCSGVSEECEEVGGLIRKTVHAVHPHVSVVHQSNLQHVVSGVYKQWDSVLFDTRQLNTSRLHGPLYWRLPSQFEGNQLLSYGGLLSYDIVFYAEDGSGLTNQEPQILIKGGTLRKLVIYTDVVAPQNGIKTQHEIRLTEHKWKYFNSVLEKPVSHNDYLSVLGNIQYVIVKASYGTRLQQSRISNITWETAVEDRDESGSELSTGTARLVESCECPPGYAGLSCQECAPGYFRQPQSELSPDSRRSLIVRPCIPCRCNNHSMSCDPETGVCERCQHHTSGRNCELCAPGYYGNIQGAIADCSPCTCPLLDNSFSSTCVTDGAPGDFRCTACQAGYEGRYCERCSAGYFGDPSTPSGVCTLCSCSAPGSLHSLCDILTGQCECKLGVTGQRCDRCDSRHVSVGADCVSCDDECTGVLLNNLEEVEQHRLSVNMSRVVLVPYHQLIVLENRTRDLQLSSENRSVAQQLSRHEGAADRLASDLHALTLQVTHLTSQVGSVSVSVNGSMWRGTLLCDRIKRSRGNIQVLMTEAGLLNQTKEDDLDMANQTLLLEQVQSMLEMIRVISLSTANTSAQDELSLSESVLLRIQQDLVSSDQSSQLRLRSLSSVLTIHMEQLQTMKTHLMNAALQSTLAHALLEAIHSRINQYQSLQQRVSTASETVDVLIDESQHLLAQTVELNEDLNNSSWQLDVLAGELDQFGPLLRRKVDRLIVGLKMTDALESIYRAENFALQLQSHAHTLNSALSPMWNTSQNTSLLLGTEVSDFIASAQELALSAKTSAELMLLRGAQSLHPRSENGGATLNGSSAMLEESFHLNKTFTDLQLGVSVVSSRQSSLSARISNTSLLLNQSLEEMTNDSFALVGRTEFRVAATHSRLQVALQRISTLQQHLEDSSAVVRNTNSSVDETEALISQTHTTANQVQQKLEEAELRTVSLVGRIKPLNALGETLSRNLSDIRELIDQARRQAASIKVAVQADRSCVRTYKPQVESSNFNTLTLTLKTSSPDNLLFFLGSKTKVDFMAVEMHGGRVALVWNVGSGSQRLEFPGLDITNNRWTRINATRFGALGTLSVYQPDSAESPHVVTATSPGLDRVLDVDNSSTIHIGGLSSQTPRPAALHAATFKGCLGEVLLNEKNLGLWNYISREGECGGCFSSPQGEETAFNFDGSGFSVVRKPLRATSTSIVLLFKTLSPGGLLLYLASNNTRDYLSIELVDGSVRLTFDLGSGPLVLTSNRKYNTGVWHKITLQRSKRKGYLSIMAADQSSEKEVLEAESPGTASDLNRSDQDPIYIGGLPTSRPIRRQVISRSYIGCIKNVEIARSNFDLLKDSYGIRKGCVLEAVRSISVFRGGFVQTSFRSLGSDMELLFSFSSKNLSGILLTAFSDARVPKQHFLSVSLDLGSLKAELGEVGQSVRHIARVTILNNGSFADGQKHSVIVKINRKSLTLHVDEGQPKSLPLRPGLSHFSPSTLFIGGLPAGDTRLPVDLQKISRTFQGCIQHVAVNGLLLDLSEALRYEGVEMDRCVLQEPVRNTVLSEDQHVEPTADSAALSAAPPTKLSSLTPGALTCGPERAPAALRSTVYFGSSKHSHMTFIIRPGLVRKSVLLQMSMRTRAKDGLMLLLSDSNHMDQFLLSLKAGRLLLSVDLGRGPTFVTSPVPVNDGQWHVVRAELSGRWVSLSADGSTATSASVKGNQLDVESKLYLGGIPPTLTSKKINVSSSFPGCIQSVRVNDVNLDFSQPATKHDVTSCFTLEQAGSYFNGSGFASLLRDGFKVGSDLSMSLDVRTSKPEGVLVGISSAKVDAIGLEMINGQVVFNVNNGAGRVSVRTAGKLLCDGQWHHLLARKTKHTLTLIVDGLSYTVPNPYPQSTSAETNNPVYLGGFPDDVKQNCLSTRTRFRGCLRNIQLIKPHLSTVLDPSSAHHQLGVVANSCPAA